MVSTVALHSCLRVFFASFAVFAAFALKIVISEDSVTAYGAAI